jgi:hypothetical protein
MGRKRGTKPVVRRVGGVAIWWLLSYPLYLDSSKNYSVVLHTPESLFDLYGKAVRGELPEGAIPFAASHIGSTCEHATVIGYLYGGRFVRTAKLRHQARLAA